MKRIALMLLFMTIFLFGCTKDEIGKIEDDYPLLQEIEHIYKKVGYNEVINALTVDEGSHIIMFAFKQCPFCVLVIPILNEVAIEEGYDLIMYYDVLDIRRNYTAEYQLLVGYLDHKVGDITERDGKKTLVVPDVYFVKDGVIYGHHIASILDAEGKYILDLTDEETEQLKEIYRDLIKLIK